MNSLSTAPAILRSASLSRPGSESPFLASAYISARRRLQMTNFVNHMKICRKSIDKDVERRVPTESVLKTTIGAMDSLIEVCEEELRTNPNLIAWEIEDKTE